MTLLLTALVIFTYCDIHLVISLPASFDDKVHLEKLSTVYLPYHYGAQKEPEYGYNKGIAEQTAYDPDNNIVFVIGGNMMHVIDITNVISPKILHHIKFGSVDLTDIEFCGGDVFISMDNLLYKEDGRVVVFRWNSSSYELQEKFNITVGSLPDMIMPTKDCKTVIVAIEAEAYESSGLIIDPEGGIGIIKIMDGTTSFKTLDFRSFNDKWSELEPQGLRFIHRENSTFANDVEPEYIALSDDEKKAYICLQENNGIAVVDLETETIDSIQPLGFKNWWNVSMDVSDKDGGINMKRWPLLGMYQPDTIQVITVGGKNFLVTANEGDSKDYSKWGGFNEETRIKYISLSETSDVTKQVKELNISDIKQDAMLGRLKITTMNGKGEDGKFDALYTFGGRSFSIRNLDTMKLVYDSGDSMSRYYEEHVPTLFNSNGGVGSETVSQSKDSRSDDKGVETESLEVAHIGDEVILFIGTERPGSIFIYKIRNDVRQPEFQSMWHGVSSFNGTWEELYNKRKVSEIDPEDIKFIPPEKSPTGYGILIAVGTVSSTLSVFKVNGIGQGDASGASGIHIGQFTVQATLFISIVIVMSRFNG